VFSDPEIVKLLREKFVCVGIAHNGAGRRKDAEGEFANKIIGSGGTLQGLHVINTAGELVGYVYDFRSDSVMRMLQKALQKFTPVDAGAIDFTKKDPRFVLPEGGVVVDATTKILGGYGEIKGGDSTREKMQRAWKSSLGREHLWVRKDEAESLSQGALQESLKNRIVRYHLVDNTRGTPTGWRAEEVKKAELSLSNGRVQGSIHLETESGDRGFVASILGFVESKDGALSRFDLVAKGEFWGEGKYTPGAPKGRFPMAVAFSLADRSDALYKLVPDAVRCYPDYMR
jgi:hypothetical protein